MTDITTFIQTRLQDEPGIPDQVAAALGAIVDLHSPTKGYVYGEGDLTEHMACAACGELTIHWPCKTLHLVASIWPRHRDFDPKWKVV